MNPVEVDGILQTMRIAVDTREQDTDDSRKRYESFGVPWERKKLNFGDYSAIFKIGDEDRCIEEKVVVERKMSADELAMCFTSERKRFQREFERAAAAGARIYLLVEGTNLDKIINHDYRSRFSPNAFIASLTAWCARYNLIPVFCSKRNSGRMIAEILRREAKEIFEREGETDGGKIDVHQD